LFSPKQLAKENAGWGYDRLVGALANLGHQVSDQTVGNILRCHGLGIAPERKRQTTWAEFIRRHKEVLWATDFFAAEVWSANGLITIYVLFFHSFADAQDCAGWNDPDSQ
jgi:putative transposase